MNLEPGLVIAGRYRVLQRLGAGAMGEVWSGVHLADGQTVAIKVLLSGAALNNEVVARFKREAQVLARVQSPFVARVLDFLTDPSVGLMLVMELIQGESMLAMLRRAGKISIETALELASDITRGLLDLHQARIVHRDLKPGNIVLRPNQQGELPTAILIDFGMSRVLSGPDEDDEVTAITRGDRVLGTLEYIAPEQILIARSVTGAADLYALGCILFRAVAGHHVFGDAAEARLVAMKLNSDAPVLSTERYDEVAVRTQALVARLLSRRVRDRFQEAGEVLEQIEAIISLGNTIHVEVEEEEEELATICLPAHTLELATAQAMVGTVQGYQIEATPGPPPPPQPPVATVQTAQRVQVLSPPLVQAPKQRSAWASFLLAIGVAMVCGGVVGWLLFRQFQPAPAPPASSWDAGTNRP